MAGLSLVADYEIDVEHVIALVAAALLGARGTGAVLWAGAERGTLGCARPAPRGSKPAASVRV